MDPQPMDPQHQAGQQYLAPGTSQYQVPSVPQDQAPSVPQCQPVQPVQAYPVGPVLVTIGDISVEQHRIVTPAGVMPTRARVNFVRTLGV